MKPGLELPGVEWETAGLSTLGSLLNHFALFPNSSQLHRPYPATGLAVDQGVVDNRLPAVCQVSNLCVTQCGRCGSPVYFQGISLQKDLYQHRLTCWRKPSALVSTIRQDFFPRVSKEARPCTARRTRPHVLAGTYQPFACLYSQRCGLLSSPRFVRFPAPLPIQRQVSATLGCVTNHLALPALLLFCSCAPSFSPMAVCRLFRLRC